MHCKLPKSAKYIKRCYCRAIINILALKCFCGIFSQSFDAFRGHSNIFKINCKAVFTTSSSNCFRKQSINLSLVSQRQSLMMFLTRLLVCSRAGAISNCQLPITLEVIANDPITNYFSKEVIGNCHFLKSNG